MEQTEIEERDKVLLEEENACPLGERSRDGHPTPVFPHPSMNEDGLYLPPEVWLTILGHHISKDLWPICRDVCHLWNETIPPPVRLSCRDKISERVVELHRKGACARIVERGWIDCAKYLATRLRYPLRPLLESALRKGDVDTCKWIARRCGEKEEDITDTVLAVEAATSGDVATFEWICGRLGLYHLGYARTSDGPSGQSSKWGRHRVYFSWSGQERVKCAPVIRAASMGHVDILEWIWSEGEMWSDNEGGGGWFIPSVAEAAASSGMKEVLRWMAGKGTSMLGLWTSRVVDAAARAGRLDVVKWLIRKTSCVWDPVFACSDDRVRHAEMFKWAVLENGILDFDRRVMSPLHVAAFHGNVECMRWLADERGIKPSHGAMNLALYSGRLDAVIWLLDRGIPMSGDPWPAVTTTFGKLKMEEDGDGGGEEKVVEQEESEQRSERLSLVEWLLDHVPLILKDYATSLQLAEWAIGWEDRKLANRIVGAIVGKIPGEVCRIAALRGDIDALQLARDWFHWKESDTILRHAASGGNVKAFEWLLGMGCPHSPRMSREREQASLRGRIEMVAWIDQWISESSLSSPSHAS